MGFGKVRESVVSSFEKDVGDGVVSMDEVVESDGDERGGQ